MGKIGSASAAPARFRSSIVVMLSCVLVASCTNKGTDDDDASPSPPARPGVPPVPGGAPTGATDDDAAATPERAVMRKAAAGKRAAAAAPASADVTTLDSADVVAIDGHTIVAYDGRTGARRVLYRHSTPEAEPTSVDWSPTGDGVSWQTWDVRRLPRGGHEPGDLGRHRLFVTDPRAGNPIVVSDHITDHEVVKPEWSPDGSRIAFTLHEPKRAFVTVVARSDGDGVTRFDPDGVMQWTPDSQRIVYGPGNAENCPPTGCADRPNPLHIINRDGTGNQPIAYLGSPRAYHDSPHQISASGEYVLFYRQVNEDVNGEQSGPRVGRIDRTRVVRVPTASEFLPGTIDVIDHQLNVHTTATCTEVQGPARCVSRKLATARMDTRSAWATWRVDGSRTRRRAASARLRLDTAHRRR